MQSISVSGQFVLYFVFSSILILAFSLWISLRLRQTLRNTLIKNEKLKFLFTKITPTPIIRTDENEIIIYCNEEAQKEFHKVKLLGSTIRTIFTKIKGTKIPFDSNILVNLDEKYYTIEARYLDIIGEWQIYFYNVTKQVEQEEANRKLIERKIPNTNISKLTKREKQVFDLVSKGLTSEEIAAQLSCCKRTVTTHRNKINKKMTMLQFSS